MPVEGRDLSSRQTQYVVKDLEIGQPINSASGQILQKALRVKLSSSRGGITEQGRSYNGLNREIDDDTPYQIRRMTDSGT